MAKIKFAKLFFVVQLEIDDGSTIDLNQRLGWNEGADLIATDSINDFIVQAHEIIGHGTAGGMEIYDFMDDLEGFCLRKDIEVPQILLDLLEMDMAEWKKKYAKEQR